MECYQKLLESLDNADPPYFTLNFLGSKVDVIRSEQKAFRSLSRSEINGQTPRNDDQGASNAYFRYEDRKGSCFRSGRFSKHLSLR